MRKANLESDHYISYMFKINAPGYPTIRISIESDKDVSYVLLDASNYIRFYDNKPYRARDYGDKNNNHLATITLPCAGKWYLVIMNRNITAIEHLQYHVEYLG